MKKYKNIFNSTANYLNYAVNLCVPILILPYLKEKIGLDGLGIFVSIQAILLAALQFIDLPIIFEGTRQIKKLTINADEYKKSIFAFRNALILILFVAFVFIMCLSSFAVQLNCGMVILIGLLTAISIYLQKTWIFQIEERFPLIAFINILTKLSFLVSIIIFDEISLYLSVGLLLGINIISGLVQTIFYANKFKSLEFVFARKFEIYDWLRKMKAQYVAGIGQSIHTQGLIPTALIFFPATVVGEYAILERIVRFFIGFVAPINQVVYPYACCIDIDSNVGKSYVKKMVLLYGFFGIGCTALMYLVNGYVFDYFKIDPDTAFTGYAMIGLSILPMAVSSCIGNQFLIANGMNKEYLRSIFIGEFFGVLVFFYSAMYDFQLGVVATFVAVEMVICIMMTLELQKKICVFSYSNSN